MKPQPWGRGNVKQEVIVRNVTYNLPHELPKYLGLKILENEELLRLFTLVFIDLIICGFELELVTRNSYFTRSLS